MKNREIREAIKDAELKQWQVAEAYGLHEGNFSRLLRNELPKDKKEEVLQAIREAKESNEKVS
ncbi:hypothetical protein LF817_11395 [Halobacillus sp. A1]|uniref:hypothetical protein n=1 Tax=Halobacillus sp. A1 TaxID=2880262 RepID=UPI0020A6D235|nr:hypothetical protein [Halobacillus sp. A1]MCP3031950.1 hypothetical protein [Halobacillus sp. A1]